MRSRKRRFTGPMLASVGLHAALLVALIALRQSAIPALESAPGVLRVAVMPVFDGADTTAAAGAATDERAADPADAVPDATVAAIEDIGAPPAPQDEAPDAPAPVRPEPVPPVPEPVREAEPPLVAEATVPSPPMPAERERPSDVPVESPAPRAETASAPPEPNPAIVERRSEPVTEPPPPAPEAVEPVDVRERTDVLVAEAAVTEAAHEAATVPQTTPLTATERGLIEHRVAAWAESFVALGDWQAPTTTWTDRGREYTATVTRLPAESSMGIDGAVVTVSTERDGVPASTEMRMQRLSFSHFAQFIDRWDPEVQIHDDVIDGRFHSNSEIFIDHSRGVQPMFTGKVTTARGINTSRSQRRVRRDEVFLGGLETRAGRIALPNRIPLFADDDAIDPARVHRIAAETRIVFFADGSYIAANVARDERSRRRASRNEPDDTADAPIAEAAETRDVPLRQRLGDEPHYLIAAEDARLHVSGTVNGKVLVYSPDDIVIEGDLVYADDPALVPDSDDYLGLVSERNVEIAPPEVTGPGDLHVHAAIYARRRFAVASFRSRAAGTLVVHGSVTAGSLTATEPRYSTELQFDERLATLRPPRFPVTDRFEIADWDGRWTLR